MSSAISENVQITVMTNSVKEGLSVSINDYFETGGVIGIYIQLTYKQAHILADLINEKIPRHA
jgi:hypothetical protein